MTVLLLAEGSLSAQSNESRNPPTLRLEQADSLEIEGEGNDEIWRVSGNVRFIQGEAFITCVAAEFHKKTELAEFTGPVTINDGRHILIADRVRYNGKTREEEADGHVTLKSGNTELASDWVRYSQPAQSATASGKVIIHDLIQDIILMGESAKYDRVSSYGRLEGRPHMMKIDSAGADTLHISGRIMQAWGDEKRVLVQDSIRIKKGDMRAVCERLQFFAEKDSIALEVSPAVWQNDQKMTADTISIRLEDTKLKEGWLWGNCRIVSLDSLRQDMITGKTAHLQELSDSTRRVVVQGQATSIYHVEEDEPGINIFSGDLLVMTFEGNKLKRLRVVSDPGKSTGTFAPKRKGPAAVTVGAGNAGKGA